MVTSSDRSAVIWDVDGTLVDTAELHFQAWQTLAHEIGKPFTREDFEATFGMRNADIIPGIFGKHLGEDRAEVFVGRATDVGAETHTLVARAVLDDPLYTGERATANEQDVRRVDLDELLVRMLASTLRRNIGYGAFQDLEKRLLHAFT